LDPPIHSESDAWLLALSGIIFGWYLVVEVVRVWVYVLGIPTALVAVNLIMRHFRALKRWPAALVVSFGLFFATPFPALFPSRLETANQGEAAYSTGSTPLAAPFNDKKLRERVDAMCAAPTDADTAHRCALQREADAWQAETDRQR